MGNKQAPTNPNASPTKDKKSFEEQFSSKYELIGEAKNVRYGQGKVYKNKDSGLFIIEKQILIPDQPESSKQILQWNNSFDAYEDLEHKNIVLFFGRKLTEIKQQCGPTFKNITCYFEYLPKCLNDDLQYRATKKKYFKEAHLWYVLYHIILPGAYLNQKNKRIGEVGLNSILINEKACIKVLPEGTFINDLNLSTRNSLGEVKYIHPKIADILKNGQSLESNQLNLNDVYALGVTLYELMNLEKLPEKEIIDEKKLTTLQQKASENFSPQLVNFVGQLMKPLDERPSFQTLKEKLDVFSEQILKFQPFTFNNQSPTSIINQPVQNQITMGLSQIRPISIGPTFNLPFASQKIIFLSQLRSPVKIIPPNFGLSQQLHQPLLSYSPLLNPQPIGMPLMNNKATLSPVPLDNISNNEKQFSNDKKRSESQQSQQKVDQK